MNRSLLSSALFLAFAAGVCASEPEVKLAQGSSPKTTVGGYIHFQFRDTDQPAGQIPGQPGTQTDAFQIRRARLNVIHQADARLTFRLSGDFATGANQLGGQLKDAYAIYNFGDWPHQGGYQAYAGQFPLPISHQLIRSDTEREFPERTQYMATFFNGERSRGVYGRFAAGNGVTAFVGGVNALAISDFEQANIGPGPQSKLAVMGGVTYMKEGVELLVSGLVGKRAGTTNGPTAAPVAVPETDHRFFFLNAGYDNPAKSRLSARFEFMTGKDRVPGAFTAPLMGGTEQRAWSLHAGFKLTDVDGIYARYEDWDRNSGTSGFKLTGYGVVYLRELTPAVRFTATYESYKDDLLAKRYGITTLRLQYKF